MHSQNDRHFFVPGGIARIGDSFKFHAVSAHWSKFESDDLLPEHTFLGDVREGGTCSSCVNAWLRIRNVGQVLESNTIFKGCFH